MAIATASEKIAADLKESMDSLREEIVIMEADLAETSMLEDVRAYDHLVRSLAEATNMWSEMEDRYLQITRSL
jgi:hypothetical protein